MSILYLLDLIGVFAFGLTGGLVAKRKDMDLFGFFVLALVTATGGGTLREIMLGNTNLFLFYDPTYIIVIIASALCTFVFHNQILKITSIVLFLDAIGLGTFVCIGMSKALAAGVPAFGAVIFGLLTAVGGGVLRDVLAGEVPMVLHRDFYAVACIIGGVIYIFLYEIGLDQEIVMAVTTAIIIALRVLAIKYKWNFIAHSKSNS
jgi:uncharacterized membrane protein YeiH